MCNSHVAWTNRRKFLQKSANPAPPGPVALTAASASYARVMGANDKVNLGGFWGWRPGHDSLTQQHVNNFLECLNTRKRPNGDVLLGHRSAQASHLGNLAYEQKRRIEFDPERE